MNNLGVGMTNSSSKNPERYWCCPLYFFSCDRKSVDLGNGIQIIHVKQAPAAITNYFLGHYMPLGYTITPVAFDCLASITCSEIAEDPEMHIVTSGEEEARAFYLYRSFIEACRLHKKGSITAGPLILFSQKGSIWHVGTGMEAGFLSRIIDTHQPKYNLRQSDIPMITELMRDIYRDIHDIHGKGRALHRALARFNSSYGDELEDKLIDQMIAFESLYIADDKELGYKLSLRTAFLLGKNRTKIFNDMRKAYELRGQIVHGNEPKGRSKLEETIPKTEEYLRRSIRKFLSLSKQYSIPEIRKLLDENIIKNGKPLALKD